MQQYKLRVTSDRGVCHAHDMISIILREQGYYICGVTEDKDKDDTFYVEVDYSEREK